MLSLLISIMILLVILALCWWVLAMIPIPPQFKWVVQVVFAIVCLICLFSLLTGAWSFPIVHPLIR